MLEFQPITCSRVNSTTFNVARNNFQTITKKSKFSVNLETIISLKVTFNLFWSIETFKDLAKPGNNQEVAEVLKILRFEISQN